MTTPDPLAELRVLAAAMRKTPIGGSQSDFSRDLDRILSRLGEARVMWGQCDESTVRLMHSPNGMPPTTAAKILQPHLVIPIKETDRAD